MVVSVWLIVLCYFPKCALFQGDQRKTKKNLNVSKSQIHGGIQDFLSRTFEHFYIAIWSCMLLENVLEILPLVMPKTLSINLCLFGDVNNAL
jgi:hypothetical protein